MQQKKCNIRCVNSNVERELHERVVVYATMFGTYKCSMRVKQQNKLNVIENKCLRSLCGVTMLT